MALSASESCAFVAPKVEAAMTAAQVSKRFVFMLNLLFFIVID
jgi:hypothetical protein